ELLFTALARSGPVEAAAMALDQWQGRTVQDRLAAPRLPTTLDHGSIADQLTKLTAWLPGTSKGVFAGSAVPEPVLSAMRGLDLLALIVADGDLWRLTANHGPPVLSKIGRLDDFRDRLDNFRGHPTNTLYASKAGAFLLSDDVIGATNDVLHVLVDVK